MSATKTREQWLQQAIRKLRPIFKAAGIELPREIQVSCGFPGGGSARARIGECWSTKSAGGVPQVFINPTLDKPTGPQGVLATLAHELIHAWDDCQSGHGGAFRKAGLGIGLEGAMAKSTAGAELQEQLAIIADKLGPYPHKAIKLGDRKKQTTRQLKVVCYDCDYIVRLSQKAIDYGLPSCPCGNVMERDA